MDRVVLADAGPLIHLAQIHEGLAWLERLFGPVAITHTVRAEILPRRNAPGEREIREALQRGILYEIEEASISVELPRLGRGELSTILAALDLVNQGKSCLVIVDDRKARKVIQQIHSAAIAFAGTGAIVVLAKKAGLVDSATVVFEELRENGLYASRELIEVLLKGAGEPSASKGRGTRRAPPEKSPRSRKPR